MKIDALNGIREISHALLLLGCCGALSVSAQPRTPATLLPAYSVGPEFVISVHGGFGHSGEDNRVKFASADNQPHSYYAVFIKFRSATLQAGDEVVSVSGKSVSEMKPFECFETLLHSKAGEKINLEVRQPSSKTVRKAIAVQVYRREVPNQPTGPTATAAAHQ